MCGMYGRLASTAIPTSELSAPAAFGHVRRSAFDAHHLDTLSGDVCERANQRAACGGGRPASLLGRNYEGRTPELLTASKPSD